MAGVERVSVHVSRLAHCPDVFFVEFSRAGSVGNLVVPLGRSEAEALRDELGGMGGLGVADVVVGNMASICSLDIGLVSSSSVWRTLRTTYRMPANRLGTPTIARITPRPFHQSADSHSRISLMSINLSVPLEVSHAVSEA